MERHRESVRLAPSEYEGWLEENPKTVVGGPISLERDDNGLIEFVSRQINTVKLPDHYAKKLYIYCSFNQFNGLKIKVTPENYDYLLMAHPTHKKGTFKTDDGNEYGNWPHFHELDYYKPVDAETPGKRWVVTSGLYLGMPPEEFLKEFKFCYYIEDGGADSVRSLAKCSRQRGLSEEYGK